MALTYTAVVGRVRQASEIDQYLYDHTERVITVQTKKGVFAILATTARPANRSGAELTGAEKKAEFLATYQAERLRSGLFAAWGPETDLLALLEDKDVQYVGLSTADVNVEALAASFKLGAGR